MHPDFDLNSILTPQSQPGSLAECDSEEFENLKSFILQLTKNKIAMAVFVIADIKIIDDSWVPGYATQVHTLVEKHGGKYLSRSGMFLHLKVKDSTLRLSRF